MDFKTAEVSGLKLFYREAGAPLKPTIVLLHGFPSSSHEFHDLIPLMADRFHVIAPGLPWPGYSDAPDPNDGSVQRTPSARQTPKHSTAKYQKMDKELLP